MLRRTLVVALLCLLAAGPAAARPAVQAGAAAAPQPVAAFAISGRGWGHGVGMSQYGAYGFARNGHDYASILAHYYPGTQLGQAPIARVRVLLAEGKRALAIGSDAAFTIRDASGVVHELDARLLRLGPGFRVQLDPLQPAVALPGPLVFSGRGGAVTVEGKRYRGTVEVAVVGGKLRAVNHVALDAYLFGVVPDEVPPTWPAEALKAQAVVARSYALAVRKTGGAFDLYADVRSQAYGGIDSEEPTTTAAVLATIGQVLLYEGRVATTFFFSTSGGRTANVADAWPGSQPIPYLVSVPDPFDSLSPHHRWGPFAFAAPRLVRAFGLRSRPVDARVRVNASGRVTALTLVGADGSETTVPGGTVRTKLELRSTWFRVGVLALDVPAKRAVRYGGAIRLTGRARALPNVALERRVPRGAWERVAPVKPKAEALSLVVKPQRTGDYRLVSGTVATQPIRVAVGAFVRLDTPTSPTALTGIVRPVAPGAPVTIQRQEGRAWVPVATATVDEAGAFRVDLPLTAGTYRARAAAVGGGVAPGVSKPLTVLDA